MATINKGKKRKKEKHSKQKEIYDTVYNTVEWQKLRKQKIENNPLCEMCLNEGKVKQVEEVHHIIPITKNPELAFTYSNLLSLCKYHHHQIHKDIK